MKKQIYYALLLCVFAAFRAEGQHSIATELIKKIEEVQKKAAKGYELRNSEALIKAADILIRNPEIQQFEGEINTDTIQKEHQVAMNIEPTFFNPTQLLADAEEYRPVDARILKWRIRFLEKKLKNYTKMAVNIKELGGGIKVKNYLVYSKNSKTIATNFPKNKTITLSVRVGNDLRLSVWDKDKKKRIGKSEFIGNARIISFTTSEAGIYQIKIENVATEANDCLLMIETK
ncbi:MAG: hypothetical protein ACPG19_07785 [Saprospiraceae bacterium]